MPLPACNVSLSSPLLEALILSTISSISSSCCCLRRRNCDADDDLVIIVVLIADVSIVDDGDGVAIETAINTINTNKADRRLD